MFFDVRNFCLKLYPGRHFQNKIIIFKDINKEKVTPIF